jgi:hypothetical protein
MLIYTFFVKILGMEWTQSITALVSGCWCLLIFVTLNWSGKFLFKSIPWALVRPRTPLVLVKETGENHRPVASHWQTLSHNVVLSTPHHEQGSNSQMTFMSFIVGCLTEDFCEFALTELHTPVWYIVGKRRTSRIEIKMSSLCIVVTVFLNWCQKNIYKIEPLQNKRK